MGETGYLNWRPWLVLGRVSNLPTVWSNCLCGWLLGGAGNGWGFVSLLLGATLLYLGGMYWNDALDVNFDRRHRRERPIPSMQVSESAVWFWGGVFLATGTGLLGFQGGATALLTLFLLASIIIYDATHKVVPFSPILMACCRFFLLLVAASVGESGVTGLALWAAWALAGWILGLSYVARRESIRGPLAYWPLLALTLPVLFTLLIHNGPYRWHGIVLSGLLGVWTVWCLKHAFSRSQRNVGRTVSGLLAGICLVDLLAAPPVFWTIPVFVGLFLLSLLAQRVVPAT